MRRPSGLDLARAFTVVSSPSRGPQRTAEGIGVLLGARRSEATGLTLTRSLSDLLLQLLGKTASAAAHRVERPSLAIDGAVRVALAERAFGIAHGVVGLSEVIALARLTLARWPCRPCWPGSWPLFWPIPRFFISSRSFLSCSRRAF